jgi:RND family efflux transporter MFP subunit
MVLQQRVLPCAALVLFLCTAGCAGQPLDRLRPTITVKTVYPGASAAVVADTVAAPIEQEVNGVEGIVSMLSRCTNDGTYTLHITFARGTDLNFAMVLVQNRVNIALPFLPDPVKNREVTTRKGSAGVCALLTLSSPGGRYDQVYLGNYARIQLQGELARLAGVSDVFLTGGADYALRVWLDPEKMAARNLTFPDVTRAIEEQKSRDRPFDVEQLSDVILKAKSDGPVVRLRDLARLEFGAGRPPSGAQLDGKPVVVLGVGLLPQARPQEVSAALRDRLSELRARLPEGLELDVACDFIPQGGPQDPPANSAYLLVEPVMPDGTSAERTLEFLERCATALARSEDVRHTMTLPENPFAPFRSGPSLLVVLAPSAAKEAGRERARRNIRAQLEQIEGAAVRLRDLAGPGRLPPASYPIDLALSGPEQDQVRKLTDELVQRLARSKKLTDLGASPGGKPERQVFVDVDRTKVKCLGVALDDVDTTLQVYGGSFAVNDFALFGRTGHVQVQASAGTRGLEEDIHRLKVRNTQGAMIPLSALVTVRDTTGPAVIDRLDFRLMVEVTANPAPGVGLAEARWLCETLAEEARKELGLPREYRLTWLQELPPPKPPAAEEKVAEGEPPPPEVTVSRPIVREATHYEDFTGRTHAAATVELRARVTGQLDRVHFKEGTDVKKGDLLFQIDSRPLQALLDQAQANLGSMKASAVRAEAAYKRTMALTQTGAATREDVDRDRGDLEVARAAVVAGEAAVQAAKFNLEMTRISAPISGRIGRCLVDPGNLVKADDTLLATLVSLEPMYVYFDVDERTWLRLSRLVREAKTRSPVDVNPPAFLGLADEQGYPRQGTVNFVDNKVDADTGTLRMRAVFANGSGLLAPGMFARIRLPIGSPRKALLVPEEAVGTDVGQKFLYVVNEQNKVVLRHVTVGAALYGLRVIEEGLEPEERVVSSGGKRVRPGMTVKPREVAPSVRP